MWSSCSLKKHTSSSKQKSESSGSQHCQSQQFLGLKQNNNSDNNNNYGSISPVTLYIPINEDNNPAHPLSTRSVDSNWENPVSFMFPIDHDWVWTHQHREIQRESARTKWEILIQPGRGGGGGGGGGGRGGGGGQGGGDEEEEEELLLLPPAPPPPSSSSLLLLLLPPAPPLSNECQLEAKGHRDGAGGWMDLLSSGGGMELLSSGGGMNRSLLTHEAPLSH